MQLSRALNQLTEIGRVARLHRYPVKSMRGEAPDRIALGWTGLDGDRQYAFHKSTAPSRFPWFTARIHAEMVLYAARYTAPDTKTAGVSVTAPDGAAFDIAAPELVARFSAAAGMEVGMIRLGRGCHDSLPVSVIGQGTIDVVSATHGAAVGVDRFRPNIVIDAGLERDWLGRTLVFGDTETGARLAVNRPIERCAFITVDPLTASRDATVMRTVVERFNNEIGVHCVPERLGELAPGMKVWLA